MSRRWEQRDIKSYNRRNERSVHFPQAHKKGFIYKLQPLFKIPRRIGIMIRSAISFVLGGEVSSENFE